MLLRRNLMLALVLPAVFAGTATYVAACSSDTSANGDGNPDAAPSADGSTPTDGSTPPNPTWPDGASLPLAKGDPCRGTPLPADQHFVASGLCARLVSAQISGLRQIMFTPNGDLFGQSANGKIYLLRDADEDGFFAKSEIHPWADTGSNGNNAHVDVAGGYVYAGSNTAIQRFSYDATKLTGGPAEDVVVNIPTGGHSKHTTHVYDGFLYVHSGSSGNLSHSTPEDLASYDKNRSLIKRFDLSKFTGTAFEWTAGEVFTVGLRNANGFKRNEITQKIYAVVNGSDNTTYKGVDVHTDNPGEQVVELAAGKKYGYPYCFTAQRVVTGDVIAPGTQLANDKLDGNQANPHDDAWCAASSDKPTTFVEAHTAPLDLSFFDHQAQGALPEKWRGGVFIAMHGAWNRDPLSGYKVVWQPFNADGTAPYPTSTTTTTTFPYEVVFGGGSAAGGPNGTKWSWSADGAGEAPRPAGVAVGPIDGALYVASDQDGYLYRIGIASK